MLTLKEVDKIIKEVFDESKVRGVDTVYEKADGDFYKLVISLHGLTFEDTIIVHTKIIFKTNLEKTALIENSFIYLYDIKCVYKQIKFEGEDDLKNRLIDVINSNLFGNDLQNLSEFMEQPATRINHYLKQKGVEDFSVYTVEYDPKFKMAPCEEMKFDFAINVNDKYDFQLSIDKKEDSFKLSFKLMDEIESIDVKSMSNISMIVSDQLMEMLEKRV